MRVLHSGDWHVGELTGPVVNGQNARLLDTLRCLDFMVEYAQRERPDAVLVPGDVFDKSKLWGDNILSLIGEVEKRLRLLAKICPTVVSFGTDNHDSMKAFFNLASMRIPNLFIETQPKLFQVMTASGLLQVGVIPGFDKGYFRALHPGMEPAEESMMCSKLLGDMVNGLSAQLDPTIPSVLMAHYTVVGCELDNGQHVFSQSEVVLPKEALAGSAFDLVALGHIHRAQQVECAGKPVFYSGPPNGITFNEEGQDKGFWVHEISETGSMYYQNHDFTAKSYSVGSEFVITPYRKFLTIEVDFMPASDPMKKLALVAEMNPIKDKIVKLEYECTEEQRVLLNHKEMESLLKVGGAFHVSEIKTKRIVEVLTKQELTETSGPLENLYTWLVAEGFKNDEITSIIDLARPLIATISAKMPTGTLSGIFVPKSLRVKNYRSYLSEYLDFQAIYFAIVNGENGIGKSSLFMDAPRDCIYEETRTGVTGEWITNGQTDGMIDFIFGMGVTDWRIIRNRSIKGSGKITLALQEYVNDKWEDRSGTTTRQTQEKIEALIGMDCATFSCTALIMQDAYGSFMEASKEDRMSVLANILGLGVYEQLTDLAKAKVSELNKSLAISRVKMAELDEKLKAKPGLDVELQEIEHDLKYTVEDILAKEIEIKDAEELVRTLKSKAEKAEDIKLQIKALNDDVFAKQLEISTKRQAAERAQKMLAMEAAILTKSEEYEKVRDLITVLGAKKPRYQELMIVQEETEFDISAADATLTKLAPQITDLEKILASKPELDAIVEQYDRENARLGEMDNLAAKANDKNQEILEAEKDTDRTGDEIYDKRLVLKDTELRLEELVKKSAMLANANCVDPENAKCAFLADAQKAKAQIPIIEAEIKAIEKEILDMTEARKPFVKIVMDLEAEYKAIGYDIHNNKEHRDLRELVKSLLPSVVLAGQLDSKAELLAGLLAQAEDATRRKDELQAKLADVTEAYNALNIELSELPELQQRLPKLLQWVSAKDELPAAKQIVLSTADVIKGIEADIAVKEQTVKELEEEQLVITYETIGLPTAELNVRNYRDDLKLLQVQQNDIHARIGALTAQLEALTKDDTERQQLTADMVPTAKSLTHYQTLTRAFGLDGIPFAIIRAVVPELSNMANDILGQMTGGQMSLKIETERVQRNKKEVNAIEVWIIDYRGNISYGNRSGGQKVKAALANAFALADLKARRAGIQLGMMHVDEPPFLDAAGIEAYCDALEGLNHRYPNMRVIAISHDPAMKARFPQQIEVVDMGNEGSKVRIA